MGIEIVAIVLLILIVVALVNSVVIVRQGYEYTVEFLGKYTRSLEPGFHILVPILEKIGAKINRMEQFWMFRLKKLLLVIMRW